MPRELIINHTSRLDLASALQFETCTTGAVIRSVEKHEEHGFRLRVERRIYLYRILFCHDVIFFPPRGLSTRLRPE